MASPKRVIFLDFDGVLNTHDYLLEARKTEAFARGGLDREACQLDPQAISVLNEIVQQTGAEIVVSSAWRCGRDTARLREILKAAGFKGTVLGRTPRLPMQGDRFPHRGEEIQAWLDGTEHVVAAFVILDDESDMEHLKPRLVQTSFWFGGLTEAYLPTIVAHLTG